MGPEEAGRTDFLKYLSVLPIQLIEIVKVKILTSSNTNTFRQFVGNCVNNNGGIFFFQIKLTKGELIIFFYWEFFFTQLSLTSKLWSGTLTSFFN